MSGRMGQAIEQTLRTYPGLLENNQNLLFMLKCRQFVEMVNGSDIEVSKIMVVTIQFLPRNIITELDTNFSTSLYFSALPTQNLVQFKRLLFNQRSHIKMAHRQIM